MRIKYFLLPLLIIAFAHGVDIYFGGDYVFPDSKETRGKNNPDYVIDEIIHPLSDLKNRWSDNYGNYKSQTPDYMSFTFNVRGGFYLSERNRVGLEFLYTQAESDAGFNSQDSLTASSKRNLDYSTLTAHFAQELWSGLFVDGKAGWAWRYNTWNNKMREGNTIVEEDIGGRQITGPAFGIGLGWNQRLFSKISIVLHMNWIYHFYIDDQIVRARIFTLNAGLNWGMHYHNIKQGKN
ncbi:MAG: hypothetical protein ACLFSQ_05240 [Candidatus Zixiibacteriota bacterium]